MKRNREKNYERRNNNGAHLGLDRKAFLIINVVEVLTIVFITVKNKILISKNPIFKLN